MAFTNHITSSQGFRLLPPPVRPIDQETTFAAGDALLIEQDGDARTVIVAHVTVSGRQVRPDLHVRWVLYTLRFYDDSGEKLLKSQVIGEKALERAFRGWIWWVR
jgi:hypothetical protein